jgi:hypothetical protein
LCLSCALPHARLLCFAIAAGAALTACGGAGSNDTASAVEAQALKGAHALDSDAADAWTTIANEGERFTVAGTQIVRYGSGDTWITLQVDAGGDCSNAAFGADPLYGVYKQCQVQSTAVVGWTPIATEWSSFTVNGTQTIRYGSGSSWITKTVSGGGECTNAFFGVDPLYGVVKQCDVASAGDAAPPTPAPAPAPTAGMCTPSVAAADTSGAAATVGDGSPASCTEAALNAAVQSSSVVKFNCGAAPATIAVSNTINVPTGRDTVIDGENRITLDGGGSARILSLVQPTYRSNTRGLTLQHITLRNARASGGRYVAPDPANPSCAYGYADGMGAAIMVLDARLHVIDVRFQNNAAATPGPDIGGGAVFAAGSLDVTIVGSQFVANSGANAGAVGMLQSNLRVFNSDFTNNVANGVGQNYASAAVANCPGVGHAGQGGAGGNGGAIAIDGEDDTDVIVCGSTFVGNRANELAGALFRTSNFAPRRTSIDRSNFRGNSSARQGGALFIMNSAPLEIVASTFSGNSAPGFGAAQLQNSRFDIVNSTFSGNVATSGVGGALFTGGSWGESRILNSTFADNRANGGPGLFSAAIFGDSYFAINNTVFSNNTSDDPWNPMQCTFAPASGSGDMQWPSAHVVGDRPDTPASTAFPSPTRCWGRWRTTEDPRRPICRQSAAHCAVLAATARPPTSAGTRATRHAARPAPWSR